MKQRILKVNDRYLLADGKPVYFSCNGITWSNERNSSVSSKDQEKLKNALNMLKYLHFKREKLIHSIELINHLNSFLDFHAHNGLIIKTAIDLGLPTYYEKETCHYQSHPYDVPIDSALIDMSFK